MKKVLQTPMMFFVMAIAIFATSCESLTSNKTNSKEEVEENSFKFPTITEKGVAPFLLDASFIDIPPRGDYYDNIILHRFYSVIMGDHVVDITDDELNEYYDDFGSDAEVLRYYGTGIVLLGNDTLLMATYDEDGIISEVEVFSEKLHLENGIQVGLSSEIMASKYNAIFLTTDYFAGEAWMCYDVKGLPKNIILWATNIFDIFEGYPGTPTNGVHINDYDCFFQYTVPMDMVKHSFLNSICIKKKEYESFHPKE